MTIRYPKTVTFQSVHEGWHNAGRDELADNFAVFHASLFKLKDGLSRDRVPFHAGNFGKLDHLSASVT